MKYSGVGPRPASQEEESGWFRLDKPTPLIIRLLNLDLSILVTIFLDVNGEFTEYRSPMGGKVVPTQG